MSYIQRKANYAYGIQKWLNANGCHITSPKELNKYLVLFLKNNNLPYVNFNSKYKGINTADLINAELVQDHFLEFKKYIKNNLSFIDNETKIQESLQSSSQPPSI